MDVTPVELEAVLRFPFPAIRETVVDVGYGVVTVECACGEDTYAGFLAIGTESVRCICGRESMIRVYAEPKPQA